MIDEDLVDVAGVSRDEFIVHVHQVRDLGLFTSRDEFEENGDVGV